MTEPFRSLALFAVAFVSGAINSIAGGGSLLTFAVLLPAGVTPLLANATSTVALLPGALGSLYGYRQELQKEEPLLPTLLAAGVIGGIVGAWLLLRTGEARFSLIVPWLVGGATLVFAFQRRIRAFALQDRRGKPGVVGLFLFQLLVSTYGGFFGAAMGILMLAAYGLMGVRPINRMNALKVVAAVATNGVAAVYFIIAGRVIWHDAAIMAVSATLGGYLGARYARRSEPRAIERLVVLIGILLFAVLLGKVL